jgi:threonine aldolase
MRQAMIEAEVGDDVYEEDPTINRLERTVATRCGKEAGLFVCSGTMSNQLGLRALLQPMQSVICDTHAHIYLYESTATSHLSHALLIPVEADPKLGYLTVDRVRSQLRTNEVYLARTTVISLEIPIDGLTMSIEELRKFRELADEYHLKIHLDGARLWNSIVAEGRSLDDYCQYADTVSSPL